MRKTFAVSVMALVLLLVAPIVAFAQSGVAVTGSVTDESGAPIAGVTVTLKGPATQSTESDAKGAFAFSAVPPGIYVLSATKAGYTTAVQNDITILAGQSTTLAVRMGVATFSTLRTIASVRTTGNAINTSAASVNVVNTQTFINQAQPQVTRVLSQVPGLQISFPSNSANAAAPGAITIPNIRAATSYETASLIDGHPISVGQYGDNVTTFLNAFMFSNIEVIKGPGADSPEVNNAIGGTTNFHTKDPTASPAAQMLFGVDNRGGTLSNFSFSDTVGRLGFVIDLATDNNPSALNNKQVYYDPSFGQMPGIVLNGNSQSSPVANTNSYITNKFPLLACCYTLYGSLDQTAELAKLRYKLSPSTAFTVTYMGNQSTSDQNGNTSDFTNGFFTPGPGYSGPLQAGPIQVATIFPGAYSGEFNNEPIIQGEIASTIGKDSILARYYQATISRYQFQGGSPSSLDYNNITLYGTSSSNYGGTINFNGAGARVGFNDFYQEPELDKLQGGTFEYQHPLANNDLITFSAERTWAQSTDYSIFSGPFYSFNLPPGTNQTLTTYLLRGHFYAGPRLEATLSNYFNTYSSTYPINCVSSCNSQAAAQFGTGVIFQTTNNTHFDPRVSFVFRPNSNSSIRASAGSAIAPPFLGLLNQITSAPSYSSGSNVAIESQSNGNLKPETGFGYDLGGDVRLHDHQTIVTGDVYLTNLFNRFFGQTVNTGLVCGTANPCSGGAPPGTPIVNQTNTNISNARFEGIELELRRQPAVGFGFDLSGALQRGYYYNLPPYFYCSIPGPGCTPDQNLNIISGENTNGVGVGIGGLSYNGNMRIPYSQGNAEFSYSFSNGAYASLGETYYGHNNSLNEPAFGIGYATVRYPINDTLALQISGDNIFNAYPGYLPINGGGVAIPLYGGGTAATTGNVLGPATWRLMLMTRP
ncbi:MAG TPA: TonB-dependent receptor [Candidatus Baltobacteraceae bacterium]|nr:TonB-dependent receptor [Candidatus Baltobacteraceae bacterium]